MRTPLISVIVPARNEGDKLLPTIRSIARTRSTDCNVEIVIVDDASTDGCCRSLAHKAPRLTIKILRLKQRVGVPSARNHGAQNATGKILFITDSHVRFGRGWDEYVLSHINKNRVIAATITDINSAFRAYGCSLVVPFMGTEWNREPPKGIAAVQIASSAGTVLERELFSRIGGYDSGMILYGAAEPEFSVRSWLSGAEIVSIPPLLVQHRFKTKVEIGRFLRGLRPFMIHNSLRFGLLYLSDLAILQMVRYYALSFPRQVQRAFELIAASEVKHRRTYLEKTLVHDFNWYIKRFSLKDQIGQTIL